MARWTVSREIHFLRGPTRARLLVWRILLNRAVCGGYCSRGSFIFGIQSPLCHRLQAWSPTCRPGWTERGRALPRGTSPLSSLPKVFELFSFFFFYLFSFLSLFFPRAGGRFKEKDEIWREQQWESGALPAPVDPTLTGRLRFTRWMLIEVILTENSSNLIHI